MAATDIDESLLYFAMKDGLLITSVLSVYDDGKGQKFRINNLKEAVFGSTMDHACDCAHVGKTMSGHMTSSWEELMMAKLFAC